MLVLFFIWAIFNTVALVRRPMCAGGNLFLHYSSVAARVFPWVLYSVINSTDSSGIFQTRGCETCACFSGRSSLRDFTIFTEFMKFEICTFVFPGICMCHKASAAVTIH